MGSEDENLSDYEEGARRALEWLGRSEDAAELAEIVDAMLAQLVGQMPPKLGDMEIAFLIAIGRAALDGHKAAPQSQEEAKARPATLPPPAEAPPVWTDVDAFRRRKREHELAAKLEELGRRNQALFLEQGAFTPRNQTRNDADWW
jgi:hypothetical protein